MARTAPLTQTELTRYAKALAAAGVSEYRIVARADGTLEIVVGAGAETGDTALKRALDAATGAA